MTQHGVISVHSTDRNNPKNLDPSYKTDLDFLGDCLGKVKKSVSKPKKYGISAANRNSGTIYFPAEKNFILSCKKVIDGTPSMHAIQ